MSRLPPYLLKILLCFGVIQWGSVAAADNNQRCGPITTVKQNPLQRKKPATDPDQPVHLQANEAEMQIDDYAIFKGNVELQQQGLTILAEELRYDKTDDHIDASGDIDFFSDLGDRYSTEKLKYYLIDKTGNAGAGSYQLAGQGRGFAGGIVFEHEYRTRLYDVNYTTCPETKNDWFIKISELEFDRNRDIGIARHAVLKIRNVPIFYWPYIDFPLSDQRKSGFLAPQFGSSDRLGMELGTPYYFNISPQIDDTLTPHNYGKRGFQLQNELRYMGRRYAGRLDLEHIFYDQQFGDARSAATYNHQQTFGRRWSSKTDLNWVSDNDYLDDFSSNLNLASQTHLLNQFKLAYSSNQTQMRFRILGYQTIDSSITNSGKPYNMLPEITVNNQLLGQDQLVQADLLTTAVYFQRPESIVGGRLTLQPSVSIPFRNSYSFVVPKATAYYLSYDLSDTPNTLIPGQTESLSADWFGLYSLDSGLYFDRSTEIAGSPYTQTLEPRLFYLNVPKKNQDDLPIFDTTLPDLTFNNIFRENRFVGGDRIGDANQLTIALTSRFLDDQQGVERFYVSVGDIVYFDDRKVNLVPDTVDSESTSDIIAESGALLKTNWYFRGIYQWDTKNRKVQRSNAYIQYNPAKDSIINIGYRLLRDTEEQTDVSFQWPVASNWSALGRWRFSLDEKQNLESLAGITYRSCCWSINTTLNRRLSGSGSQTNSIWFQFELTGLAQIGNTLASPLKQSLFSFDN